MTRAHDFLYVSQDDPLSRYAHVSPSLQSLGLFCKNLGLFCKIDETWLERTTFYMYRRTTLYRAMPMFNPSLIATSWSFLQVSFRIYTSLFRIYMSLLSHLYTHDDPLQYVTPRVFWTHRSHPDFFYRSLYVHTYLFFEYICLCCRTCVRRTTLSSMSRHAHFEPIVHILSNIPIDACEWRR